MAEAPFNFDLDRMRSAVEGETISIPPGLSREERRRWVANRVRWICKKCLHVGQPVRTRSKNASVWYRGCAACGSGVFFSK